MAFAEQRHKNTQRAQELLEGPASAIEAFTKADYDWICEALDLAGWRLVSSSSSGNGCNYVIGERDIYVPLRVRAKRKHKQDDVNGIRSALHAIANAR